MWEIIIGCVVATAIWSWMVVGWIILPTKFVWIARVGGSLMLGALAGTLVAEALQNPSTVLLGFGMAGSAVIAAMVSVRWWLATQVEHEAPSPPLSKPLHRGVSPVVFRTKPSGVLNQRIAQRNG